MESVFFLTFIIFWLHLCFCKPSTISFILQPHDLHTCITACSLAFEERIKNFQGFQRWHALVQRGVLPRIQACLPSFQENLASQARQMLQECLQSFSRRNAFPNRRVRHTKTQKHYICWHIHSNECWLASCKPSHPLLSVLHLKLI